MLLLHEWPLVLFTLLVQTALGIVLVGECLLRSAREQRLVTRIRRQSCFAFCLFALAGLLSLWHTGSPLHSVYTLSNIASSWLSREIAMLSLTGFAFFCLAFLRLKDQPCRSEKIVALITIVAGLVLVAVMSRVYRLSVVPAWNSYAGLLAFFAAVPLFGALWHGGVLSRSHPDFLTLPGQAEDGSAARPLFIFAFVGLILAAMSLPLSVPVQDAGVNMRTALIPLSCLTWSLALRALLTGVAVMLFCLALLRGTRACSPVRATSAALLLLAFGEFLGRALFYLSYARLGM